MQLLLIHDAMTNSLISGGWETFENSNNFFRLFSRHLVIKSLILNSSGHLAKKNLS
jgi:hypothetical protein